MRFGFFRVALMALFFYTYSGIGSLVSAQVTNEPLTSRTYSQGVQSATQERMIFGSLPTIVQPNANQYPKTYKSRGTNVFNNEITTGQLVISVTHSEACSLGRFNQRLPSRYYVFIPTGLGNDAQAGIAGAGAGAGAGANGQKPQPKKIYGIANGNGFNLYDPNSIAEPAVNYFFDKDRSSNCKVYVVFEAEQP